MAVSVVRVKPCWEEGEIMKKMLWWPGFHLDSFGVGAWKQVGELWMSGSNDLGLRCFLLGVFGVAESAYRSVSGAAVFQKRDNKYRIALLNAK